MSRSTFDMKDLVSLLWRHQHGDKGDLVLRQRDLAPLLQDVQRHIQLDEICESQRKKIRGYEDDERRILLAIAAMGCDGVDRTQYKSRVAWRYKALRELAEEMMAEDGDG